MDYRELNKATLKDRFPLPFIDQLLDTLVGKRYFSFLDVFNGYNQIRIALEDQEKKTLTCPRGTYAYKVLPFRFCNAPTTFQREILGIFSDILHDCIEVYMDDFIVMGGTFEEALHNLRIVLQRCRETNLSLSNEKCFMIMTEGIVLGHHVYVAGIKVDLAKIEVIGKFPPPMSLKGLLSFLQHEGYYRGLVENFTKVASPLFILLTEEFEFHWSDEFQAAFDRLKEKLSRTPILRGPNWKFPFHISTDTSDLTIVAVLDQK